MSRLWYMHMALTPDQTLTRSFGHVSRLCSHAVRERHFKQRPRMAPLALSHVDFAQFTGSRTCHARVIHGLQACQTILQQVFGTSQIPPLNGDAPKQKQRQSNFSR